MPALITIAIPCFNSGRWLRAAIESALTQTWQSTEVIVADDGSTDDSVEVARSFGGAVRVLANAHRGGNHARNCALREARGEWVQFLDADDYLEPEKLAQQLNETDGGAHADIIYSPTWMEDTRTGTRERGVIETQHDLFIQWITWQLPQTGGCLWRKSALDALGGWKEDQPCCQEHELYLRALQAGLRFVFAPTPHAVYRLWSEQTLCRRDPRKVIEVKTGLLDQLQAWLAERGLAQPAHADALGRACFEMSRTWAREDLAGAATYHAARRARGMIVPSGPAAPASYRALYQVLGFAGAERVARWLR
ncbi:MAG: glycosyltransferase [Chthoniobacter sp.]|nr:glycosyltransferase [Chthoniobacter sp.]